jgi:hypothetical protein
LGIIVEVASFGEIHRTPAMVVAFGLGRGICVHKWCAGRGMGQRDQRPSVVVHCSFRRCCCAAYLLWWYPSMFAAVVHAKPHHLVMPGATTESGTRLVYLNCAAEFARFLHVATELCSQLYGSKRQNVTA